MRTMQNWLPCFEPMAGKKANCKMLNFTFCCDVHYSFELLKMITVVSKISNISPNNPSNLRLYFNHFSVRVRKRIIHESTTFACNVSGWRRAGRGWTPSAARPRRTGATTRPRPTLARPPPPTVGHQPQLLSSYPSNLYLLEL